MHNNAIRNYLRTIKPESEELILSVIVSSAVMFFSIFPTLLVAYDLLGARHWFEGEVLGLIKNALTSIDKLEFSATLVTFAFWSFVGLLVYSVLSSISRVAQNFEQNLDLSTKRYIHSSNFTSSKYWGAVATEVIIYASFMAIALALLLTTLFVLLPAASVHIREIVINPRWSELLPTLASFALLVFGVWLVIQSYKWWRYRLLLLDD